MDKILVVGDAIIDTNIVGECHRLSPEGPWPILKAEGETSTLGGAANVAAHIANSDIECIFAFKLSEDPCGEECGFLETLEKKYIVPFPLRCDGVFPISTKKRILAGHHQTCRVDYENTDPPDKKTQFEWYKKLMGVIRSHNISIVVLSDYNKGTLTDELIQMITNECFMSGVKVLLDPKRPSFVKLRRLYVIKPNGKEIPATNMTAENVSLDLGQTFLVNTIGKDGVKIWQDGQEIHTLPSVATNVVDVCGCGDSFHAVMSIALQHGFEISQAVKAGNRAAAYAISHHGTYVLTPNEIEVCLQFALK